MTMQSRAMLAVLAAALLAAGIGCTTSPLLWQRADEVAGVYEGELSSRTVLIPVSTTLVVGPASVLRGQYVFLEGTNRVIGSLYDFRDFGHRQMTCTWMDPYGMGTLRLTFATDLKAFRGTWGPGSRPVRALSWTGHRIESTNAPSSLPRPVFVEIH